MSERRTGRSTVLIVLVACALLGGCAKSRGVTIATATATIAATPTAASATPSAVATASPGVTSSQASAAAQLAALNGLRCVGQWQNTTRGTSGAFATRLEAGGAGGAITFEVGGAVFGGSGGTFEAPFRLVGNVLEIEADSDWLGHMSARVGLDGTATGTLRGVAALGPTSLVTVTDYSFVDNRLAFNLRIEPNNGGPAESARVEAACSR